MRRWPQLDRIYFGRAGDLPVIVPRTYEIAFWTPKLLQCLLSPFQVGKRSADAVLAHAFVSAGQLRRKSPCFARNHNPFLVRQAAMPGCLMHPTTTTGADSTVQQASCLCNDSLRQDNSKRGQQSCGDEFVAISQTTPGTAVPSLPSSFPHGFLNGVLLWPFYGKPPSVKKPQIESGLQISGTVIHLQILVPSPRCTSMQGHHL